MMYITSVWDRGLCMEDLRRRTAQRHTGPSIIIVTSLTLGADMIDGGAVNDWVEIAIATKVTQYFKKVVFAFGH